MTNKPRKKPPKAPQKAARLGTSVRLDEDLKERLEAIAKASEASLGYRPTLADTLRGCVKLGIVQREDDLGIKHGKR